MAVCWISLGSFRDRVRWNIRSVSLSLKDRIMYIKYITHSVKRQPFYGTKLVRYQGIEVAIARRFNRSDIDRAYSSAACDVLRVR